MLVSLLPAEVRKMSVESILNNRERFPNRQQPLQTGYHENSFSTIPALAD